VKVAVGEGKISWRVAVGKTSHGVELATGVAAANVVAVGLGEAVWVGDEVATARGMGVSWGLGVAVMVGGLVASSSVVGVIVGSGATRPTSSNVFIELAACCVGVTVGGWGVLVAVGEEVAVSVALGVAVAVGVGVSVGGGAQIASKLVSGGALSAELPTLPLPQTQPCTSPPCKV